MVEVKAEARAGSEPGWRDRADLDDRLGPAVLCPVRDRAIEDDAVPSFQSELLVADHGGQRPGNDDAAFLPRVRHRLDGWMTGLELDRDEFDVPAQVGSEQLVDDVRLREL